MKELKRFKSRLQYYEWSGFFSVNFKLFFNIWLNHGQFLILNQKLLKGEGTTQFLEYIN